MCVQGTCFSFFLTAPTGPPQNIFASEIDESSLTLVWDPPLSSEQNGIVINYVINMTTEEGDTFYFETTSGTYTFLNLEPFRVYHFLLAAQTISGQGPFSSYVSVRTGEAGRY